MEQIKRMECVPFDVELAKKIQAGQVPGKIKTRNEIPVRIICWDRRDREYPIVALIADKSKELMESYSLKGEYLIGKSDSDDLILYVPCKERKVKPGRELEPFQKVLVRFEHDSIWEASLFSHYCDNDDTFCTVGGVGYDHCLPYNEETKHLLGTTDDWKE